MSSLGDKLQTAHKPFARESNIKKWLVGLNDEDRKLAWEALRDETILPYTLLNIFKSEGGKFDKGTFMPFRRSVLDGTITEEDIHGS